MPSFTLLKGGLDNKLQPAYIFKDAFVTDTRLMGVVGLMVHWNKIVMDESTDVCHFFYYDAEEYGLDSLSIYYCESEEETDFAWKSCFGGLGAERAAVSERQARYLIQSFIQFSKDRKLELPENIDEVNFVLNEKINLSDDEIFDLNSKLCVEIKSDYAAINYFLMRMFGKDSEGAKLLLSEHAQESDADDISFDTHASFLKNTIHEFTNPGGSISYLSESLVENEGKHYIVTSEMKLGNKKVLSLKKNDCFKVSLEEVSMLLSREEYCTVYKITVPMEYFDIDFLPISIGTTKVSHESGDIFMDFKDDNSHVESKEYRLYNDLKAVYFVSDYGELVVAAYSPEEIKEAEKRISESDICPDLQVMVKMQLAHSVLFDFAESGCSSFAEFIQSLE